MVSNTSSSGKGKPSYDFGAFAAAQIQSAPPFELGEFGPGSRGKVRRLDAGVPDNVLIAHDNRGAAIDARPHRQFRLEGDADLADENEIEGRGKRGGDFGGHDHAAARQRQHDRPLLLVPASATASSRLLRR